MNTHIAELFLEAKEQILISEDYSSKQKTKALYNLLTSILEEVTQSEKIVFTTLFARASFVSNKYQVDSRLMFYLHLFRRDNERLLIGQHSDKYVLLGSYVIDQLVNVLFYSIRTIPSLDVELSDFFDGAQIEVVKFKPVVEAIVDHIDDYDLYFYEEEDASKLKVAKFDQVGKNELFNDVIRTIESTFGLPIHVNLIDVEILSDGAYVPNALVLCPDYLVDVTAIANCFKDYGSISLLRIISKYKQIENSIPLMVGNIANLFLDEIISAPDIMFGELLPKVFKLDPIGISIYSDSNIRELIAQIKNHYLNLKRAVAVELPSQGIKRDSVFLEPSFYSRDFGLQGRLDLFHLEKEKNRYDIIELKSGSPFRANVYGLSASHYSQTLLYDLIVKSTFGSKIKPNNYILYSKLKDKSLKYAPPVRSQQYEALKIRNELIALEYKLASGAEETHTLLEYLSKVKYSELKGFELKDLERFQKFYKKLSEVECSYFDGFTSFIAREHVMSKTGEHGINKSNGLSALWLENVEEKEDRFSILKSLTIEENNSKNSIPSIRLKRDQQTNALANFRKGDIAVLYPQDGGSRAILKNQIFKCTILDIDQHEIEVKLRSKQYNDSVFVSNKYWNIEPDSLDSGFNVLYRSLFEFFNSDKRKRDLWMGIIPPRPIGTDVFPSIEQLTSQQNNLLDEMTNARDYYLLWGPPGTGKTSVMLKSLTQRVYECTDENILLLAYTNRAVDEMCAAIESIDEGFAQQYIRVGSSTSCGEKYKSRLVDRLIEDKTKREEIRSVIQSKRIVVSTVASIVSRLDLFKLKKFDRVLIDEASQILEPMLVGLLSRIEKVILIGDHKQLPAVVTQRESASKVQSEHLLSVGISDMRMSLFERLYYRCVKMGWDHALGILSYQGRMHKDVMKFPNEYFYENKLGILPKLKHLNSSRSCTYSSKEMNLLCANRFIYFSSEPDTAFNWKTNRFETLEVLKFVRWIEEIYKAEGKEIKTDSIGIITPYRAQIATIRKCFEENLAHLLELITVDTVERFQGGARDIIIVSLCTNRLSQLKSLVSLSDEGIDRKLNVAMTRAREQLIVIGNEEILSSNETYKSLIQSAFTWKDENIT